jgi:hypothetical protein
MRFKYIKDVKNKGSRLAYRDECIRTRDTQRESSSDGERAWSSCGKPG